MKGQEIVKISTRATMYDNNCLSIYDDKDNHYYMKVEEIMKFTGPFNEIDFKVVKKRVHSYLEVK
jgi:hypothetical protein